MGDPYACNAPPVPEEVQQLSCTARVEGTSARAGEAQRTDSKGLRNTASSCAHGRYTTVIITATQANDRSFAAKTFDVGATTSIW